ncbi:hypothetical protein SARC_06405 [Sphaeroforma arctica JP610]|uniref:Agd3 deacetylase domain-containing protein n=1 Tax=Sphaeroforma arctica JP610 TaxID=667725 RepID=A0A0L0FX88_9EUKA|nr:hypothetical protein SARC_06405 [Sphaeroforma arctica JP610]KNC81259.1 hypothetical protein SARC_06405 [Sphaeroforma arctica JP610]|eukprot:XP_014155161.1 hypothetical protein SARC_06405 [Sphaeroforma arctica JP610]
MLSAEESSIGIAGSDVNFVERPTASKPFYRKRVFTIGMCVLAVAAICCAIAIPLSLNNSDGDPSIAEASSSEADGTVPPDAVILDSNSDPAEAVEAASSSSSASSDSVSTVVVSSSEAVPVTEAPSADATVVASSSSSVSSDSVSPVMVSSSEAVPVTEAPSADATVVASTPVAIETEQVNASSTAASSLGLRTLILASSDFGATVSRNILSAYGSPHDVYIGSMPNLTETPNKWHSIVIADSGVGTEIDAARAYAKLNGARIAVLDSIPSPDDPVWYGVQDSAQPAMIPNVTFDTTVESKILAGITPCDANWNLTAVSPLAVTVVDSTMATGLLKYQNGTSLDGNKTYAAFVSNTMFGTQELHLRFRNYYAEILPSFSPQSNFEDDHSIVNIAVGHVWYEWVTRGVFLGARRMSLNIHVDDWYAKSAMLDTGEAYRINHTDIENYVKWRHEFVNTLPRGSSFYLEPAYNGAAVAMYNYNDVGNDINNSTYINAHEFYWMQHTWTHANMDWLGDSQCAEGHKMCNPNATHYDAELGYNQKLARGEGINSSDYMYLYYGMPSTPAGEFLNNRPELMENNYSPHTLITPEISGLWPASYDYNTIRDPTRKPYLKNVEFFNALVRWNITNVVGDNSRPELNNPNVYHAIISTEAEYGVDGVIIVPRWSPNVAYNCNTTSCLEGYYNAGACYQILYGRPSECADGNVTAEYMLVREGKAATLPLIQLRWDPYMFHQANVAGMEYRGAWVPIVGVFTQNAVEDTMRFVSGLPFVSYKFDDLSRMYRVRAIRESCDLEGTIEFDESGTPFNIKVHGNDTCERVVTITQTSNLHFDESEIITLYGPDENVNKNGTATTDSMFKVNGFWTHTAHPNTTLSPICDTWNASKVPNMAEIVYA